VLLLVGKIFSTFDTILEYKRVINSSAIASKANTMKMVITELDF